MKRATIPHGIELAYDEFGTGGEPLVLIMGIGAQRIVWHDSFVAMLVERGFHVLRFDNRDVGQSTWLDGVRAPEPWRAALRAMVKRPAPAPYTLSDMASDTVGLLDALGLDRAHVVGASMGGMIAQHLAIEHPGRLKSMTSIMSGPGTVRHMIGRPSAIQALLGPPPTTREEAMDHNEALFTAIGGTLPMDIAHVRDRAGLSWDRGSNPAGFVRQWAAIMRSGSRLHALRSVKVPSLVIHGTKDPLVPPRAGRATAEAIPDCASLFIEGMGHDMAPSTHTTMADAIARLGDAAA